MRDEWNGEWKENQRDDTKSENIWNEKGKEKNFILGKKVPRERAKKNLEGRKMKKKKKFLNIYKETKKEIII